jgi:Ni/Co efflux regulator RcnB
MKTVTYAVAASALALFAAGGAMAQPDHSGWAQDQGSGHQWKHGERMGYNDWSSAAPVDYRSHHLRHPPRGYEWRESNGQYVLAAVATGVIASIILNSGH